MIEIQYIDFCLLNKWISVYANMPRIIEMHAKFDAIYRIHIEKHNDYTVLLSYILYWYLW